MDTSISIFNAQFAGILVNHVPMIYGIFGIMPLGYFGKMR
jgi:hypothetical protein